MLAHIGGELVVIAGVFYYYHRKTSALQQEIDLLKAQNTELIKAIESLSEDMNKLYSMIKPPQQPQGYPQAPAPASVSGARSSGPKKQSIPKKKKPAKKVSNIDTGDETLDDEDLDEILVEEYKELHTPLPPRSKRAGVKVEECKDETCSLID